MKLYQTVVALSGAMLLVFLVAAQTQTLEPRAAEIKARHDRGEKISIEDEDYYQSRPIEHNNQVKSAASQKDWAVRPSCARVDRHDSAQRIGYGQIQGEEGGLYPGGVSTPPPAHLKAGLKLAQNLQPLDAQGPAVAERQDCADVGWNVQYAAGVPAMADFARLPIPA